MDPALVQDEQKMTLSGPVYMEKRLLLFEQSRINKFAPPPAAKFPRKQPPQARFFILPRRGCEVGAEVD